MIWIYLIPLIALGLSLVSLGIELLVHDREKAKKIRLDISRKNREIKRLQKEKNLEEMTKVQKELMSLMGTQMKMQFKQMFVSIPLFLLVFWLLNGMLIYDPIYTGSAGEAGMNLGNLDSSPKTITATIVPVGDLQVVGEAERTLDLLPEGESGSTDTAWWNIKSDSTGTKEYQIEVVYNNITESRASFVNVVEKGSLGYPFSPNTTSQDLTKVDVKTTPVYKSFILFSIFGVDVTWFWYYFVLFFAISLLSTPLKNKVLWGHKGGIKHFEKLELQKQKELENDTADKK